MNITLDEDVKNLDNKVQDDGQEDFAWFRRRGRRRRRSRRRSRRRRSRRRRSRRSRRSRRATILRARRAAMIRRKALRRKSRNRSRSRGRGRSGGKGPLKIGQITYRVSSSWDNGKNRHFTPQINSPQGWSAGTNRVNQWINMRFRKQFVKNVLTQGRINGAHGQYVKEFDLYYKNASNRWVRIGRKRAGSNNGIVKAPVNKLTHEIQLNIKSWSRHITMRAGVEFGNRRASRSKTFMNKWKNGATLRLRTWKNTFVQMHSNGVHVKQGGAGSWEIFTIKRLPRYGFNCVALYGAHKRYLRAHGNKRTIDQSGVRSNYNSYPNGWSWERFWVEDLGGGKFSLRTFHNTYLRAHNNGSMDHSPYVAKGKKIPRNWVWEKFTAQWLSGTCNERISRKGHNYRGCQTVTRKGYKCQNWSRDRPHKRNNKTKYNYKRKRYGVGNHNYCRNADNSKTIWCYTTNPRKRWDYCSPKKSGLGEIKRKKVLAARARKRATVRRNFAMKRAKARAKWAWMAKIKAKKAAAERAQKLKQAQLDRLNQNKWNKNDADYKAAKAIREAEAKRQATIDSKLDRVNTSVPTLKQDMKDVKYSGVSKHIGSDVRDIKIDNKVNVGGNIQIKGTIPKLKEPFENTSSKSYFPKMLFLICILVILIWLIRKYM